MKINAKLIEIITIVTITGFLTISCNDGNGNGNGNGNGSANGDTGQHHHAFGSAWLYNETQHWNQCGCGEKRNIGNHAYSGITCTICGFNQNSNDGPKILIFTDISEALLEQASEGGFILLFPAETTQENAMKDIEKYISNTGSYQFLTASNKFGGDDVPLVQVDSGYTFIAALYANDGQTAWTSFGIFDIYSVWSDGKKIYFNKLVNVSITSGVTSVSVKNFIFLGGQSLPEVPGIKGTITLVNIPEGQPRIWVNIRGRKDDNSLWMNHGAGENGVNYSLGTENLPWIAHIENLGINKAGDCELFPATLEFWVYAMYDNNPNDPRNKGVYITTDIRIENMEEALQVSIHGTVDFANNSYY